MVKETRKITLGLILSWIFGVLFGLNGFIFLFSSVALGGALIAASLILLPPANKFAKEKFNLELSGGAKIGFIFILLMIATVLMSSSDFSNESTLTQLEENTNTGSQDSVTESQKQIQKISEEKTYSMNQDIKVDYITYKITQVETFTEMGSSMFNKKTEGKFVKVYLKLTNNAKETKQLFSPRFNIEDSEGRKYDRMSDDMMYITDYLEFGKQLQPGLTTSGAIVFELPEDSTDLVLIISGDWASISEVKIPLANIQDIGKDTTQKDEQDEMMEDIMADSQEQMDELMQQYA